MCCVIRLVHLISPFRCCLDVVILSKPAEELKDFSAISKAVLITFTFKVQNLIFYHANRNP